MNAAQGILSLNMLLFSKLPIDMKRYVYNFIDYDTKIRLIINNHLDFMTNKNLSSILTLEQIKKATRFGLNEKIYKNKNTEDTNAYTGHFIGQYTQRLGLNNDLIKALPKPIKYQYRRRNMLPIVVEKYHPMIDELTNIISWGVYVNGTLKASELINGFDALVCIRSDDPDMIDTNYLLSKVAYQLLISMIIYCEVVKKDRIERSKRALAKLTIKKAIREKKKLEDQIQNTERELQQLEEQDTKKYQTKIKRMNTRFMKENVYMQYVNQGMTLREAKDRVFQDKVEKKQQDMWKRVYIKAVKQATTQRKMQLKEETKREKQENKKKQEENMKKKKLIAQVTRSIKTYSKLAKQTARIAKKKFVL
jgi:hypothetical protein